VSFLVNYFITEILYKYKHQLWPVDFFSSTFFGFYVSNVDDGMDLLVLAPPPPPKIFCCACEPNVRDLSSSYIQGLMRLVLIQKIIPPARLEKFSHKARARVTPQAHTPWTKGNTCSRGTHLSVTEQGRHIEAPLVGRPLQFFFPCALVRRRRGTGSAERTATESDERALGSQASVFCSSRNQKKKRSNPLRLRCGDGSGEKKTEA
jgi:hypothetical protein